MSERLTTKEKIDWIIDNEETEVGEGYHGLNSFLRYCTPDRESDKLLAILKEGIDKDYEEIKTTLKYEQGYEEEPDAKGALAEMKRAMDADPDYAWGWHCNLACCIMDEGVSHEVANKAASRFMKLAFAAVTSLEDRQ